MPKVDHTAIAIYAAGIAASLAFLGTGDTRSATRFEHIADERGSHLDIMLDVAEAAGAMERFRARYGESAKWGTELPYLYDVWDAIAAAIRSRLGNESVDELVEGAIRAA